MKEKIEKIKYPTTPDEKALEDLRVEAYNKGMAAGKKFMAYYILNSICHASFNSSAERARLSKNAYLVKLDELIKRLGNFADVKHYD